eukprot:evm.model.scf_1088.4 EVM.evm.TU.scf_1088.4   scf_1088:42388-48705(-)
MRPRGRGTAARGPGAVAAALVVMVALGGAQAVLGGAHEDVGLHGRGQAGGRALSLISLGLDLAQRLADAITSGNIDDAAHIVIDTVRQGDSDSLLQGLFLSKSGPGIAQTIVRAFGLGLDSHEFEVVVESGSGEHKEAAGFVESVMALITGILTPDTPEGQPPPQEPVDQSSVRPELAPAAIQPPPPVLKAFVNGEEVRECRGRKEEKCCAGFYPGLTGCLCELGDCRFQFIRHEEPVVIMDTRRSDNRACTCP